MKKRFLSMFAVTGMLLSGINGLADSGSPDRVLAVVGNEIILKSDVDEREKMVRAQYPDASQNEPRFREQLFDGMIDQKVLLTKAKADSLKVDETAIDAMTDERFNALRSRFTSNAEMESRFGRPVNRLKQNIREEIRNQQMIDMLRRSQFRDVKASYEEVMEFYRAEESRLPVLPEGVSVSQIVKFPVMAESAKADAMNKIRVVQEKLAAKEDFAALAKLYSDDPGSRQLGGDLGFVHRGDLVPAFEEAAFSLKEGAISEIVETRFGYHIIQVLSREKERVHARHILALFDRDRTDIAKTVELLAAIREDVVSGKATFAEMAKQHSDDPLSSRLGGIIKSGSSGSTILEPSSLKPELQQIIAGLKEGEISRPEKMVPPKGEPFYALFRIDRRIPSHRLTPEHDFARLEDLAVDKKRQERYLEWLEELKKRVVVRKME